ncbi:MAG: hypothetical protein ACR2QC_01750 [Gammaproteobacteria bacterium]
MSSVEFIFRVLAGVAVVIFGVLVWALAPYLNDAHVIGSGETLDAPIMSIFFGNAQPQGFTVLSLLLARGCFGMAAASWIVVPTLQFFAAADFRPLARAAVIVFMTGSVAGFMGSLLVHIFYYGGGTIFA